MKGRQDILQPRAALLHGFNGDSASQRHLTLVVAITVGTCQKRIRHVLYEGRTATAVLRVGAHSGKGSRQGLNGLLQALDGWLLNSSRCLPNVSAAALRYPRETGGNVHHQTAFLTIGYTAGTILSVACQAVAEGILNAKGLVTLDVHVARFATIPTPPGDGAAAATAKTTAAATTASTTGSQPEVSFVVHALQLIVLSVIDITLLGCFSIIA